MISFLIYKHKVSFCKIRKTVKQADKNVLFLFNLTKKCLWVSCNVLVILLLMLLTKGEKYCVSVSNLTADVSAKSCLHCLYNQRAALALTSSHASDHLANEGTILAMQYHQGKRDIHISNSIAAKCSLNEPLFICAVWCSYLKSVYQNLFSYNSCLVPRFMMEVILKHFH